MCFFPQCLLNLLRKQLGQRNTKGAGNEHQLEIADPATTGFDLCNRVAPDVPSKTLAFRGKSGLRQILLKS